MSRDLGWQYFNRTIHILRDADANNRVTILCITFSLLDLLSRVEDMPLT